MYSFVNSLVFKSHFFRLAQDQDVPNIRRLVNEAYQELAALGLNYTATYQDEETTRTRVAQGRTFLLERDQQIVATVLLKKENRFTEKNSAYVSQLAVTPKLKRQGIGSLLMDLCEDLAQREGFESIQLDTAKSAHHLVSWYLKRGYEIVGETHWEGKTYDSWIFEKKF